MKIIDNCQRANNVEHALKMDTLDFNRIQNGDCLLIPIEDPELRDALSDQICEIAGNCEWVIPDVNKTKLSLCIDMLADGLDTTLHVEAQPPVWTKKEKSAILKRVSTDPIGLPDDPTNTPKKLYRYIFKMAEMFHRGCDGYGMDDNYDVLEVRLTDEERMSLNQIVQRYM